MLCQFSSLTGCNRWILHLFSPFLSWIQCQGSAAKTWRLMSHLHLCPSCLFIFLLYISFFFLTFSSSAFQSYFFLSPSFFLHIQFCPPFRWLGPFFPIIFAFLFFISPASVVSITLSITFSLWYTAVRKGSESYHTMHWPNQNSVWRSISSKRLSAIGKQLL